MFRCANTCTKESPLRARKFKNGEEPRALSPAREATLKWAKEGATVDTEKTIGKNDPLCTGPEKFSLQLPNGDYQHHISWESLKGPSVIPGRLSRHAKAARRGMTFTGSPEHITDGRYTQGTLTFPKSLYERTLPLGVLARKCAENYNKVLGLYTANAVAAVKKNFPHATPQDASDRTDDPPFITPIGGEHRVFVPLYIKKGSDTASITPWMKSTEETLKSLNIPESDITIINGVTGFLIVNQDIHDTRKDGQTK